MKIKFKEIIIHSIWIILLGLVIFFIVKILCYSFSNPLVEHKNEYICIDKRTPSTRYGGEVFYLILQDVKTNDICKKSVTLNTFYNNEVGDHLYFTEVYSDMNDDDTRSMRRNGLYAIIAIVVLFVYLLICDYNYYI